MSIDWHCTLPTPVPKLTLNVLLIYIHICIIIIIVTWGWSVETSNRVTYIMNYTYTGHADTMIHTQWPI